jgi:two-component system, OmpR family, sensor histidine kinase KdpD
MPALLPDLPVTHPKIPSSAYAGMISVMKIMEGLADSRGIVHWFVATLLAVLTTVLLVWVGADSTAAGMVFVVLVVWSATQAGIWLSLYVAVLCALSFDYFFLQPYHTLRLAGGQEWVAMVSFVACCLVVSRVAERARRQTKQAEQRREDVERLYELSQEMMLHEDGAGLIHDLPRLIHRIFALDGVVLYVCEQDVFYGSIADVPTSVQAGLRAMTLGQNPTIPLHSGYHTMALMLGLRPVGALGWRPALLSREVATAVSAQVAIVLARFIALEASARIEAAREGERLRTALIDSLTHELRTPLTSIRAAATTLLEAGGLDEPARLDLAKIVDEEASRLDLLIGDAVEMAEIDANVVQVHLVPQHARALLDQTVEESHKILASHRVSIDVDGEDEPAWFDPHLLARVLRHLVENAARYTPQGSRITMKSWRTPESLEFSVEDNGPGIDSMDLPLIFEKFYRGKSVPRKSKGSGMGLAITRAILIAHGGGIEASSTPGKGARFHFWVPLVEKEPATETPGDLPKDPLKAERDAAIKRKRSFAKAPGGSAEEKDDR